MPALKIFEVPSQDHLSIPSEEYILPSLTLSEKLQYFTLHVTIGTTVFSV